MIGAVLFAGLAGLVTAWPRPVPLVVSSPPSVGPLTVWVGVGDVDGDGREDLATGAPATVGTAVGWVGLWRGGSSPTLMWERAGRPGEVLGVKVAAAGDVNGDLFADVAIAVSDGAGDRVEVHLGGPGGLGNEPAWVDSEPPGSGYGADIDGIGDVDGDGRSDIAIATFVDGVGRVLVHRGSPFGLEARVWAEVPGEDVGWAGDLDGDGRAELVVGDADGLRIYRIVSATQEGAATPILLAELVPARFAGVGDIDGDGSMDLALVRDGVLHIVQSLPGRAELTEVATNIAADRVAAAGDMNGDGHADLVVARGDVVAFVIGGALQEPGKVREVATLTLDQSGTSGPVGVGDVDGDGFGDVAFGFGDAVYLVRGVATGLGTEPLRLITPPALVGAAAALGRADAVALDAADLDGDGFSDILVGARWANGGAGRVDVFAGGPTPWRQPGWSFVGESGDALGANVAAGSDVDGDGFEDAWLGAPGARNGSFRLAGYLQLVRGGARGPTRERRLAGGDHTRLGEYMGAMGDLELDGRAELVVLYAGNTPRLVVVFGDERASLTAPIPLQAPFLRQRPLIGDVDGDGKNEIITGYLTRTVHWIKDGALISDNTAPTVTNDLIASAGDVNGDGAIDMVETTGHPLCAFQWPHDGTVGVVAGGAGRRFGPKIELHASAGCPGWSVDAAGDVDGDGLGDLIVGAPAVDDGEQKRVGRVYVHRGDARGLQVDPSWTVAGERAGRGLGVAVAGAGDVDGDGFADVVVAGVLLETTEDSDVLVHVYRGNGGLGTTSAWHYAVSARQLDLVTPLPAEGRSTSPSAFVVRANAASPYGRRVALEVEAKPHGTPFDGLGLRRSAFGEAGTTLVTLVAGLAVDTGYAWRARLSTHPAHGPRQAASHWIYGGRPGEARGVHVRTRKNRAPSANPLVATLAGSPFLRLAPGVLKGATDPDGDALVARLGRAPVNGVAEIHPNGTLVYEPDPGFSGVERFTYVASDGFGGETEAAIELTVPGPDGCGLVSTAECLHGDFFLIVHLEDGRLASVHCVVTAEGEPVCDTDANGGLRLGAPACGL